MDKVKKDVIAKVTSNISLSCYNTINIVRPLFDYADKDGNVRIPSHEYYALINLITRIGEHDHRGKQEELYARRDYRNWLSNLVAYTVVYPDERTTFMVNQDEVGIIANGKIMGGVKNPVLKHPSPTSKDIALYVEEIKTKGEGERKRHTIYLKPDLFFKKPVGPKDALTPFEMYRACKAGDALISVWTHLMLNRGCSRKNTLIIEEEYSDPLYIFQFDLAEEKSSDKEPICVDHYELHPRMKFYEYYVS